MYLRVSAEGTSLEEPEDLKRFHVEVAPGVQDPAVALVGWARLDGDHAWVDVEALRRAAAGRVGARWDADFAGMLEYAKAKGWLSRTAALSRPTWRGRHPQGDRRPGKQLVAVARVLDLQRDHRVITGVTEHPARGLGRAHFEL